MIIMSVFDVSPQVLATWNLALQTIIVVLLAVALYARLRRSYFKHGVFMGLGISLHTVSIFLIMVPSLLSLEGGLLRNLLSRLSLVTLTHAAVGSLVEIMGLWLVLAWLTNTKGIEKCTKRKNVMRITIAFWLTELVLGIYIFMMLYYGA